MVHLSVSGGRSAPFSAAPTINCQTESTEHLEQTTGTQRQEANSLPAKMNKDPVVIVSAARTPIGEIKHFTA